MTANMQMTEGLEGVFTRKLMALPKDFPQPVVLNERIRQLTELYKEQVAKDLNSKMQLDLLVKDLSSHSFCEIASKYSSFKKMTGPFNFLSNVLGFFNSAQVEYVKDIEKSSLPDSISSQFSWAPVKRDEMLRILIHHKNAKRTKEGKEFDCSVVENYEFIDCLRAKLQSLDLRKTNRFQLLVRNEVHYTALDFEAKDGMLRCCVLDAAKDPKHLELVKALEQHGVKVFVVGMTEEDKLQYDSRSCSIFALDHLFKTSKNEQFFDFLEKHLHSHPEIAWEALEPSLLKNAQSYDFFDRYFEDNPKYKESIYKSGMTFAQYIESKRNLNALNPTEQNTSVAEKLGKFVARTKAFIESNQIANVAMIAFGSPFQLDRSK